MFRKALTYYTDSFKGFRKEIWILSLVSLINRAGTMVIPFLSLYLTSDVGMSMAQVGWVMTAFGVGSLIGSWLGGKLSDSIGFYPTMLWSLMLSGVAFIALQYVQTFEMFCLAILVLMIILDTFRPALFVSLRSYSKPENRTRSVTLIRLAINLGFSAGPAIGGLIIATIGYNGLFWVDGLTCIVAGILILLLLDKKESEEQVQETKHADSELRSPYKDKAYLLFLVTVLLVGITFLQYFSTVPLYYRDVHNLSEQSIGLLLALNGVIIFLVEMPLVKSIEDFGWSVYKTLFISIVLLAISFLVYNLVPWAGILLVGMVLMTVGEMINFPFANRFAMERSDTGKAGSYMALYTIAFSIAHIIGHNAGLQAIANFGYEFTWYVAAGLLVIAAVITLYLKVVVDRESKAAPNDG